MRLAQIFQVSLLVLAMSYCYAHIVYPDELEEIRRTGVRRGNFGKRTGTLFDAFLPPMWRDHVLNLISRGITKFTLDIDNAIERTTANGTSENLVFSPISLTVTLAMILLASGGQTFQEVAKILGLESGIDITHHSEIVHQMFGLLLQESDRSHLLNSAAPQCKFAFGVFVENGYPVRDQFRAVSEKIYKSEVLNVDFSQRSQEAQVLINQWVSNKTVGKINNILSSPPSPSTAVIILSALYFNGEWDQHFMAGGTKRKAFTISDNEVIDVDMMFNGGDFPYHENKDLDLKIIGLPYKGQEVTMYAILPMSANMTLKDTKSRLTPEVLNSLIENMTKKPCVIGYPRMKLSSTLHLQDALESLGLKSLFDPSSADLSVLSQGRDPLPSSPSPSLSPPPSPSSPSPSLSPPPSPSPIPVNDNNNNQNIERTRRQNQARPIDQEFVRFLDTAKLPKFGVDELRNSAGLRNPHLFADEVVHKVEMTVDERGTEAAAATSVILNRSIDSKRFIADRPFLFFIRHDPSKTIWFWATINRPVAS